MRIYTMIFAYIFIGIYTLANAQITEGNQNNIDFSKVCGTWIWIESKGICSYQSLDEEIIGINYTIEIFRDSTYSSFRNNAKIYEGKLNVTYPLFQIRSESEDRLGLFINQDTLYIGDGTCKKSIYVRINNEKKFN